MLQDHAPIGIALVRPAEIMGAEPYFHDLIAGIERVTLPHGYSVLLRVLSSHDSEVVTYEEWATDDKVSAVLLVDLAEGDHRPPLVQRLGLPAVIVGPPDHADFTAVWTDDDEAMRDTVRRLAALGHTSILHVGGPADLTHSRRRRASFTETCIEVSAQPHYGAGDYSRASGIAAMDSVLTGSERPSAAIFDSDLMALAALDAARDAGLAVPRDFSIVSWNDSALCQLSTPPLSAVARDAQAVGQLAGQAVLDLLRGGQPTLLHGPPAVLVERGSTAEAVTLP